MRWKVQARLRATALASSVLPTPGTSSMSRWPSASRATRASCTTSGLPSRTPATLSRRAESIAAGDENVVRGSVGRERVEIHAVRRSRRPRVGARKPPSASIVAASAKSPPKNAIVSSRSEPSGDHPPLAAAFLREAGRGHAPASRGQSVAIPGGPTGIAGPWPGPDCRGKTTITACWGRITPQARRLHWPTRLGKHTASLLRRRRCANAPLPPTRSGRDDRVSL